MQTRDKTVLGLALIVTVSAVVLSAVWKVPYIYTLMGFAAWAVVGTLITIDDDVPGGFSNPDGTEPMPWKTLGIEAAILSGLVALALGFPSLRTFGA